MRRSGDERDLASPASLLGAALALGAEQIPVCAAAERDLGRVLAPERPSRARLRLLHEQIRDGQDPLGEAFGRLRSITERRESGAVYTPPAIVHAMVDWAARESQPARVIDPGSGSGRFVVAAGRRFPRARLVAVELDPLASMLSRASLAASGMADRATVVLSDYRAFRPSRCDGHTLYIGNPPYLRHHRIEPEWKAWLAETASARGLGASRLAGLHVHFFLATAEQARAGDVGAFITSAEWLDVNYGALVRALLLDGLGGRAVHLVEPTARPFEDAQTTAAITCFEVGSRPTSIRLRRARTTADLGTLQGGRRVRRERLADARRWTPLTRATRTPPEGHIELGELCRVHRGAVTGANAIWVVDPGEADLPAEVLFASVTRARELFAAGAALGSTARLRSVVDLPADLDRFEPRDRLRIARFLQRAKQRGADGGYIARHRAPWWSVGLRAPAPVLATYMARRPPAIVRNLAGARHINIAHGLYPREPLSEAGLDALATALRETIEVGQGRTYAGGLTKFEPREMERLLIPDVSLIPPPAPPRDRSIA